MKNDSLYMDVLKFSGIVFLMGIVEFIIFSVFLSPRLDILLGTTLGCTFVSLNFLYLAYSVKKSVDKQGNGAKLYMSGSYTTRMMLTAAMLVFAAKSDYIHLWATVIPLIYQKIVIHIVSFLNNRGSEKA